MTSPSGNGGSRLPCVFRPLCLLWKRPDYRLTLEWASIFIRRMGSRILAGWPTCGFLHGMVAPPVELRDGRSIPLTFPFIEPAPSAAYFTLVALPSSGLVLLQLRFPSRRQSSGVADARDRAWAFEVGPAPTGPA